jgi:hypothetical protein
MQTEASTEGSGTPGMIAPRKIGGWVGQGVNTPRLPILKRCGKFSKERFLGRFVINDLNSLSIVLGHRTAISRFDGMCRRPVRSIFAQRLEGK